MSDKQSNLTDKEMEDLQRIVADTLAGVCVMADKHSIDRDSMLKYLADMLTAFAEVATIQNYKFNHTHADRIRNMSDEELAEFMRKMEYNCFVDFIGYTDKGCGRNEISCKDCRAKAPTILEWLQSEAEQEIYEQQLVEL